MRLLDIFDKLNSKDKHLITFVYDKWCLFIFNKTFKITEENLAKFIMDITDSMFTQVIGKDVYVENCKQVFIYYNSGNCELSIYFEDKLKEFIKKCN